MLTAIIITAVITFVISTWVNSSIVSRVEERTNKRLEKFNNRLDRYYQKQNNYKQRTANSLDMVDGQISKRIDKVDAHLHDLIEEGANAIRKNTRLLLSLIGVESVSENTKGGTRPRSLLRWLSKDLKARQVSSIRTGEGYEAEEGIGDHRIQG